MSFKNQKYLHKNWLFFYCNNLLNLFHQSLITCNMSHWYMLQKESTIEILLWRAHHFPQTIDPIVIHCPNFLMNDLHKRQTSPINHWLSVICLLVNEKSSLIQLNPNHRPIGVEKSLMTIENTSPIWLTWPSVINHFWDDLEWHMDVDVAW